MHICSTSSCHQNQRGPAPDTAISIKSTHIMLHTSPVNKNKPTRDKKQKNKQILLNWSDWLKISTHGGQNNPPKIPPSLLHCNIPDGWKASFREKVSISMTSATVHFLNWNKATKMFATEKKKKKNGVPITVTWSNSLQSVNQNENQCTPKNVCQEKGIWMHVQINGWRIQD